MGEVERRKDCAPPLRQSFAKRKNELSSFRWSLSTWSGSTVMWHPKARRCNDPGDSRSIGRCRRSRSRKEEWRHFLRDEDRLGEGDARMIQRLISLDVTEQDEPLLSMWPRTLRSSLVRGCRWKKQEQRDNSRSNKDWNAQSIVSGRRLLRALWEKITNGDSCFRSKNSPKLNGRYWSGSSIW